MLLIGERCKENNGVRFQCVQHAAAERQGGGGGLSLPLLHGIAALLLVLGLLCFIQRTPHADFHLPREGRWLLPAVPASVPPPR